MYSPNKISIICPNYNKGLFIRETIESVLASTYNDWELIIIDDGSTDDSLSIIQDFSSKDHRIQYHKQSNQGGAVARNKGMSMATGAYLLFLDSDDLISPDCLEERIKIAAQNPNGIGWVFPLLPFKGNFKDEDFIEPWIPPKDRFLERLIEHNITWTSMSPLWRTASIAPHYQWNQLYPRLQDIEFHTHILLKGDLIFTFPEKKPDCYYRLDEQKLVIGSRYQFLEKWGKGCHLYVHEFWDKLPEKVAPKISRTILAFLSVAGHYYRRKQITNKQFQSLMQFAKEATPLRRHQILLSWYGKLLQFVPVHIPGLNAFFKFWIR
jgi:glycosyltransferase involved in cell wall biosynthesis